jgi:acyl-CoA hydrolase
MGLQPKKVSQSEVIMTELVLPSHANSFGSIFGGVIMSWIDIAGAIAAQRHSNRNVVTASIDRLNFVAPVRVGWVVNLRSSVNFVSKTSMEIGVRVDAENPVTGEQFHTASAYLTFVSLDGLGKPVVTPEIIPETEDQKRRYDAAKIRRQRRLESRDPKN